MAQGLEWFVDFLTVAGVVVDERVASCTPTVGVVVSIVEKRNRVVQAPRRRPAPRRCLHVDQFAGPPSKPRWSVVPTSRRGRRRSVHPILERHLPVPRHRRVEQHRARSFSSTGAGQQPVLHAAVLGAIARWSLQYLAGLKSGDTGFDPSARKASTLLLTAR